MIDRRELLEKARQKNLSLMMVEKDYVLGWLLYGLAQERDLVFKGGTALSKVYFPRIWRLSEDLDFSLVNGELKTLLEGIVSVLGDVKKKSGLDFILKSSHINPDYLQLKVQYKGVLDRNWIKVDVTMDDVVDTPVMKAIPREYSDYVAFKVRTESLEEILASKLRAVIERKKCRDYFDLWKLFQMDFDREKIKRVFARKLAVKSLSFEGPDQIFPADLTQTLKPYWARELGRLINPIPDMDAVLAEIRQLLKFL
ncbi:MAG: nucleotidyl transferase AbiEii/AbiGii toxin family protein [Candidatus Aminicenantes bacterium]|nr:nucleotidyl transferase AbiEii/AbiGii toxin family protein [Candidatus Aminicenantes bacterium]